MPKVQCSKCNGSGCDPEYGIDPLIMETCPVCHGKGELKLTEAQYRVFIAAKEIGSWFLSNQIERQQRTMNVLVELGLFETHHPSGGPFEYKAI